MKIKILLPVLSLFILTQLQAQKFETEEVFYQSDVKLSGLIFKPNQPLQSKVGIVIVQGSGTSGRSNVWSYTFAETLVNQGIYVLLTDKRGCDKSEGDWKTASFHDLSRDIVAGVNHFSDYIGLQYVGIMGLSQGGKYVAEVQTMSEKVDFVVSVSSASTTLEHQIIHEMVNTARKAGLKVDEIREMLDLHILINNYIKNDEWQPYADRLEELKNSSWSDFAASFPNKKDAWNWYWIKQNIQYDPLNYWQLVNKPIFIAYGSEDELDNVPVWDSVYRLQKAFNGKNNLTMKVYKTGHGMYEDDRRAIRGEFIQHLKEWLKAEIIK